MFSLHVNVVRLSKRQSKQLTLSHGPGLYLWKTNTRLMGLGK